MKVLTFFQSMSYTFRPILAGFKPSAFTKYHLYKISSTLLLSKSMSNNVNNLDISGVYPPIITPFDTNENIDFGKLKENIEKWNAHPLKGLVVQGSNGESVFLSENERVSIVEFTKKHITDGKLVIAGSGCESTRETIKMTKMMADVGADAVMIVTPSYYRGKMTQDAFYTHYSKIADVSPIPVILYSVPANTGIDLPAETVIKLASHPNIIGMKDSGGEIAKITNMVYKTKPHNFQILAGSAGFFLSSLHMGCVGVVAALANVLPEYVCQLFDLYEKGNYEEALKLQYRLIAPNLAVTKKFGVAGVKTAMEWFGYHGGVVRSPLKDLSENEAELVRKDFKENGFL